VVARQVAARYPGALLEARFFAAHYRGDVSAALTMADSASSITMRNWWRQLAHLARGHTTAAKIALDSLRMEDAAQFLPNALVNQGWTELALGASPASVAHYGRDALAWVRRRDLSAPAIARLCERIADLAARAGDEATVRGAITLVAERDRGRSLPSYVLASRTLDAALAFARGNYGDAAQRAETARHGIYFSRSLATIVVLEADARRAAGEKVVADSLERLVATHQIVDGHFETWAMLRAALAIRATNRRGQVVSR
jgi:hypothetical protein